MFFCFSGRRPRILPAQGNALGFVAVATFIFGPKGQSFDPSVRESLVRWTEHVSTHNKIYNFVHLPQGVALG
ncbi:MAG TPA: hypothetical protein VIH42_12580 [Thermoguttaceae bacterium]